MSLPQDRMIRFEMLEPAAKLLLEYLSFAGRPLFKNEISEQFSDYLKSIERDAPRCDPMVSRLANNGFLERKGGKFQVAHDILEEVSAHAAQHERAAQQCEIATSRKYPRSEESLFIKARRAIYLGQLERLENLLEREHSTELYSPSEHSEPVATQLLRGICSENPLKLFPVALANAVCREGLIESINQAKPANHMFEWLDQHLDPEGDPRSYVVWLHQCLLRDIPGPEVEGDFVVGSLRKILQGDPRGVERLKGELLADEKPKSFDYASHDFIYSVGCYALNAFELVEERLRHGHDIIQPIMHWFWEVRTGRINAPSPVLLRQLAGREYPPIMQFFQFLLLYWAGFESHLEPGKVFSLATRYEDSGYKVLATQLDALYRNLVGNEEVTTPFLDLLKPAQLWETTLTQLESWKEYTESSVELAPEERVAWVLEVKPTRPVVTAKVQKRNKKGKWTKGRITQIEDLKFNSPDAIDPRDHQVIDAWTLRDYSNFHRVEQAKVLEALVGHPRLFSPDGNPLELVRGVPRVVVRKGEEALFMQIVPRCYERSNYGLLKLSDQCYELVVYDQKTDALTRLIPKDGIEIPESEEERVQSVLATASRQGFSVESYFSLGDQVEQKEHDGKLKVRLFPQGKGLRAEVGVEPFGANTGFFLPGQGERFLTRREEGVVVEVARDLEREYSDFERLQSLVPEFREPEIYLPTPIDCLEMLEKLRRVSNDLAAVQWPQGRKFSLNKVLGRSDISIRIRRERDWFAVDTELSLNRQEEFDLAELLHRFRKQQSRFIELDDGSYVALTEDLKRRIEAIDAAAAKEKDGRFFLNTLTGSILFDEDDLDEADEYWHESQRRLAEAQALQPELPEGFVGEHRPYQLEGYQWLVRSAAWGVGVCLADDMGLGKTVQILAALLQRSSDGPALVVAPTSVCSNWKDEAERFTPELSVTLYHDSDRETVLNDLSPGQIVVCSYGLLCRDVDKFEKVAWNTVVLDESQAIKNTQTQRYKATISLQANFRIAATGTPVENHLGELWALFRFLNPGLLGAHRTFQARYSRDDDTLVNLRKLVAPFILRRLKKDVLKDLPPKTDITVPVELSRKERLFYESLRVRAVERIEEERAGLISILAELMKLRRACCHPTLVGGEPELGSAKLERFLEMVDELLEGEHRALVFSQFVDHLAIVSKALRERGVSYQYLDGSTPPKKRQAAVKAFQEGEGDLFLISLKAGGTGLNLTAANYVVHLDPWWNPATEDQASDRAHRIGQEDAVTVYRLIGKDTIEEKILALHKEKREMVDNLLAGSDKAGKLSAEELLALLRESHGLPVGASS